MKHLCFSIFFFICNVFVLSVSAQTKPMPAQNTLQDKIYVLSHSWAEIKYNFVNIDRITFDVDSLYRATLDRVLETENDVEFYREIRRFFAAFGDGHTQLLRTNYRGSDYVEDIPAGIGTWDGRYYFTSVKKNAGMDRELLGAEIISIDGVPAVEYVRENYFPYIAESTEARRRIKAAVAMQEGEPGRSFRGKARTLAGKTVDFDIPFNYWATQQDDDQWWSYPTVAKPRFGLRFEDDIAIMHMSDFGEDMLPKVDSLMQVVTDRAPAGLILDLRDGMGG